MFTLVGAALVLGAAAFSATAHAGTPAGTYAGCPTGLKPVPASYATTAKQATARFLTTTFAARNREHHWGLRLRGAKPTQVVRVSRWLPSGWIKSECGLTAWRRSVAVAVRFPAMEYANPNGPCNACARIVFLLGNTATGWRVWGNYG